jgi:hypothetical protein
MYIHIVREDGVERNNISLVYEGAQANNYVVHESFTPNGDVRVEVGDLCALGPTREDAFSNMLDAMKMEPTITYHLPFMPFEVYDWCERQKAVQRLGPVCMRFAIDVTGVPVSERRPFFREIPPLGFKLNQIESGARKFITIQRKSTVQQLWDCAVEHRDECRDFFTLS